MNMNTNERNEFVKLDEPNILPDTAQNEVKGTDDKQTVEEKETIVEGSQDMDVALENIDIVSDDEENEDVETEYDFSTLNKLELVEILEETVQDTDVVKIKDKVAAIKFNFLRLSKEDREREMEQFILDGGEKENYEHVEDPLEIRFKSAFKFKHRPNGDKLFYCEKNNFFGVATQGGIIKTFFRPNRGIRYWNRQ